jgi:hypothetical protein
MESRCLRISIIIRTILCQHHRSLCLRRLMSFFAGRPAVIRAAEE